MGALGNYCGGLFVSWFIAEVFTADVFAAMLGIESLTRREYVDLNIIMTIAGHVFLTGGFFWLTTLFYSEANDTNLVETNRFFEDLHRPVVSDLEQVEVDRQQRIKLGTMVLCMSAGILLMSLIPNPLWGRFMFVICALSIATIGYLLRRSARVSTGNVNGA